MFDIRVIGSALYQSIDENEPAAGRAGAVFYVVAAIYAKVATAADQIKQLFIIRRDKLLKSVGLFNEMVQQFYFGKGEIVHKELVSAALKLFFPLLEVAAKIPANDPGESFSLHCAALLLR